MDKITPIEILMLDYVKKGIKEDMQFPGYWHYQYEIDAKEMVADLRKREILEIADIDFSLNSMDIKSLKGILSQNGLKVSGTKSILIERIMTNIDKQILLEFNLPVYIILSDKGKRILQENYHSDMKGHYAFKSVCGDKESMLPILDLIMGKHFTEAEKQVEDLRMYDKVTFSEFLDHHIDIKPYNDYQIKIKASIIYAAMSGKAQATRENMPKLIMLEVHGVDISDEIFSKTGRYLKGITELQERTNLAGMVYTIKTMCDERTCKTCKKHEGKIYDVNKAKLGTNFPPLDKCSSEYCRCYASYSFDPEKYKVLSKI